MPQRLAEGYSSFCPTSMIMERGEDMIKHRLNIFLFAAIFMTLNGCATVPTGPSVMVLPGPGKPFDLFQAEDATCRQWARQQIGQSTQDDWVAQRQYDIAYQQCMYANGNLIPGMRRVQGTLPPPPPPPPSRTNPVPSDSPQPHVAPTPPSPLPQ
jgi:hypothetical protein